MPKTSSNKEHLGLLETTESCPLSTVLLHRQEFSLPGHLVTAGPVTASVQQLHHQPAAFKTILDIMVFDIIEH